jgi:predicted deacetylase
MRRRVCVVLHDVAPATWPDCERLLALLDELHVAPLTLLVVPQFHEGACVADDNAFIAAIDARIARGDEVALHGYVHRDDAASPKTVREWFLRRIMTAGEGEFSTLRQADAADKIRRGMDMFNGLGWRVHGFVAPAWLASAGTHAALTQTGLRYTSSHTDLIELRTGAHIDAPCITASSRAMWRRFASCVWMKLAYRLTRGKTIVRLGLHPIDARYPSIVSAWRALLVRLLAERNVVTKLGAVGTASAADAFPSGFDMSRESP